MPAVRHGDPDPPPVDPSPDDPTGACIRGRIAVSALGTLFLPPLSLRTPASIEPIAVVRV